MRLLSRHRHAPRNVCWKWGCLSDFPSLFEGPADLDRVASSAKQDKSPAPRNQPSGSPGKKSAVLSVSRRKC
jgi:hypothetical protein